MENNQFVGKVLYSFDELPSTNDWASELIAKSAPPEGTVVKAAVQTAGRGQFGSTWQSAAGQNLLFSVVLYPVWLRISEQFELSMAVALALFDTAKRHVPNADWRIKWPNDLYVADQKAAGILIQNSITGQHIQSSIVGIGLNVNQLEFDASLPNPASMASVTGNLFHLDSVFSDLCAAIELRYLQLQSVDRKNIKTQYESALYQKDKVSRFEALGNGALFNGIIRGVGPEGRLRVETSEGLRDFDLKEVRLVISA